MYVGVCLFYLLDIGIFILWENLSWGYLLLMFRVCLGGRWVGVVEGFMVMVIVEVDDM